MSIRLFTFARLTLVMSGLLLMTNDSALAELLTNPDYKVPKTYLVKSATVLSQEQLDRLGRVKRWDEPNPSAFDVVVTPDSARWNACAVPREPAGSG